MTCSLRKDCGEYIEDLDGVMDFLRNWDGFSDRALAYEMFLKTYSDTCERGSRDIRRIREALNRLEKEITWHQRRYEEFRQRQKKGASANKEGSGGR